MAISICQVSTTRSAMDAMSSQVLNRAQMAILSCRIGILRVAISRNGLRIRRSSETIKTNPQQRRMTLPRQVACAPIIPTITRTQCTSHTEVVHVVGCGVEEIGEESGSTDRKSTRLNSSH